MPNIPYLVHRRQKRRASSRSSRLTRWAIGSSGLFSLAVVGILAALALFYANLISNLPPAETVRAMLEPPGGTLLQPTRLYDRTGAHLLLELENPAVSQRIYLLAAPAAKREPDKLEGTQALVAATWVVVDPNFWDHPGFLLPDLRNSPFDLQAQQTMAQRLVSELVIADEPPGLRRSLREHLLAAQITAEFGREKVMEWYLNNARYGTYIYGAESAASVYFGKRVSQLTLAEAALLAGVGKAPALNPISAPEEARDQLAEVLEAMQEQGLISESQAQKARAERFVFRQPVEPDPNPAPGFTRLVLEQLDERFGPGRIERGGFRILTSLDLTLQDQVACTAALQIARLEGSQPEQAPECQAGRLLPTLPGGPPVRAGSLAANILVLNPHTGEVLAQVGDSQAPQAAGSLLSPFIHLTAYARGVGPASLAWDIPTSLPEALRSGGTAQIEFQGPVSLRAALANDYFAPTVQVLNQVGAENVWRTAQQFGLASLSRQDLDRLLTQPPVFSQGQATLLEVSHAYGVFATQGTLVGQQLSTAENGLPPPLRPVAVLRMEDRYGEVWLDCQEARLNCDVHRRLVVSPQLAYLITHVLSDETSRWPSFGYPNALEIGRPAGAKIGQIPGEPSAWAVGFTPQMVVAAWIGPGNILEPGPLSTQQSIRSAAGLWHAIIQYASREMPPLRWSAPHGVSEVEVCYPSGQLPTAQCPVLVKELFLSGTEPSHPDTLYRLFQVNRETNRLATVFTPPEFVEPQVYLVVPPEAAEWAKTAGLEIPPKEYDVIYHPPAPAPGVEITQPAMFAQLRGKVSVVGSAAGDNFSYYRLQVGEGLNPQEWLQIGEDRARPVQNGKLAEWDTTDLSGLYALQLLVVRTDQRVERSLVQVTVDNQPPEIRILHPTKGQHFSLAEDRSLFFQASADDPALDRIEFYLDEKLVEVIYKSPFMIALPAKAGQHTLVVRAFDLAGNQTGDQVLFEVRP